MFLGMISCKQEKRVIHPEKMAPKILSILKEIQVTGQEEYLTHFIHIDELRTYINNDISIDQNIKNRITSITKDEYYTEIKENYYELKESAIDYGIVCKDIEYLDFIYEVEEEGGLQGVEGVLYFKYQENKYEVEITLIKIGNEYGLFRLEDLYERISY